MSSIMFPLGLLVKVLLNVLWVLRGSIPMPLRLGISTQVPNSFRGA